MTLEKCTLLMRIKVALPPIAVRTILAFVRLDPRVSIHVSFQVSEAGETFAANWASGVWNVSMRRVRYENTLKILKK